jgi:hypothetical protein
VAAKVSSFIRAFFARTAGAQLRIEKASGNLGDRIEAHLPRAAALKSSCFWVAVWNKVEMLSKATHSNARVSERVMEWALGARRKWMANKPKINMIKAYSVNVLICIVLPIVEIDDTNPVSPHVVFHERYPAP